MRRMIAGIGGLGLAVVLSQFPEYAQQYTQRLGGAVDELRTVTQRFDREAEAAGLTRQQALESFRTATDTFAAGQELREAENFRRLEELNAALTRIQDAGPVERLQSLPDYVDTDIGQRTLENYVWAVPFSVEGILYAGGGFILGYLILSGLWRFAAMPFRKRYPAYR
ncbi:DUF2937 family protein [Devosia sp. SL43]|uniref:DUF2937 family protein n=1 Tax=Devosia sp. SL43 TaxID=2806348 RepID=UPI001F3F6D61|nr:DUF2937 family protein [Devosia sp. SL43]UJW84717.1 DUF2937 family protein [Devosia sp. SL43]